MEVKPTLVGVGTLANFGPLNRPKVNQETGVQSTYYNNEVKIKGVSPCPDNKFRLLWRPEWFAASFNPQTLDKGALFVYKRNIASADTPSMLDGLAGGPDSLDILATRLNDIGDNADADTIHATMSQFFRELGPTPFLYVQQQERKVTGVDDEGNKVRTATSYYEVDSVLPFTEANIKKLVNKAKYNVKRRAKAIDDGAEPPAPWKFRVDFSDYGLDVELPETAEPAWAA